MVQGKYIGLVTIILLAFVQHCKAGLLKTCNDDSTCKATQSGGDANAICSKDSAAGGDTDGNCICTGAFKVNQAGNACIKKGVTEMTCTPGDSGNTECQKVNTNAECPAGGSKCACKADYVVSPKNNTICVQKIILVECTPGKTADGDDKCQKVDENSECPAGATKCACRTGYKGTDTCGKESSAHIFRMTQILTAVPLMVIFIGKMI
ncbi:cell death abnormality protein 1-like [Mercenaria mercenaria]|uniref:cell death abnormality protein 1-like n=1 Tax=Mercenaria mercenaria TaxID=6596 RepID=UPI00234F826A|nr:cell death abnormality protein 1-like [Mercenaria mercenaria]